MHSWNILLALSGFVYDGPKGKIGFAPKITPENFKCFFSGAKGWGSIIQKCSGNTQTSEIQLKYGLLQLKTIVLELCKKLVQKKVRITINGKEDFKSTFSQSGTHLTVELSNNLNLTAGQTLQVKIGE